MRDSRMKCFSQRAARRVQNSIRRFWSAAVLCRFVIKAAQPRRRPGRWGVIPAPIAFTAALFPRIAFPSRMGIFFLLIPMLFCGCRTLPPLPPVDLSAPGWKLQQGQAVWKPPGVRPELTGELLLATQTNGDFVVQFSKTPFALATAQSVTGQWQIEFGQNERRWSGRGNPPSYFGWLQLPRALIGGAPSKPWQFTKPAPDAWRLENRRTGESLEGSFFP
jgi:hypothetical protein